MLASTLNHQLRVDANGEMGSETKDPFQILLVLEHYRDAREGTCIPKELRFAGQNYHCVQGSNCSHPLALSSAFRLPAFDSGHCKKFS